MHNITKQKIKILSKVTDKSIAELIDEAFEKEFKSELNTDYNSFETYLKISLPYFKNVYIKKLENSSNNILNKFHKNKIFDNGKKPESIEKYQVFWISSYDSANFIQVVGNQKNII